MPRMITWADSVMRDALARISLAIAVVAAGMVAAGFMTVWVERRASDGFPPDMVIWIVLALALAAVELVLTRRLKRFLDESQFSVHERQSQM